MGAAVYYALRSIRRRPKSFISLAGVSAAVMLALILLLLFLEAEWRQSVMPDNTNNYHLCFYNLSDAEKDWIKSQEWTHATYELYSASGGEETADEYRVRVAWDYSAKAADGQRRADGDIKKLLTRSFLI
jgi:hypothetical protein